MQKIYLILMFLILSLSINAESHQQKVLMKGSKEFYKRLAGKIPKKSTLIIEDLNSDVGDNFKSELTTLIINKKKYEISDQKNLVELMEQAYKAQDPAFVEQSAPKLGQFKPANYVVSGKAAITTKKRFFKERIFFHYDLQCSDIESGLIVLKDRFQVKKEIRPSFLKFYLILGAICSIIWVLHFLVDGTKSAIIYITSFAVFFLSVFWYYFL
jgi:hypothetical protein